MAPDRAIVVGAGIIGVTTAYFLRRHGMDVTVLDRNSGVAQEASFGNAGIIAPGYVTPWAAPGMPRKILSYLLKAESPVIFRPNTDPALWRWIRQWLRECELSRYRINKSRMQRVAFYSRSLLHEVRERHRLDYEQAQGYLQLLRTQRDIEMTGPARAMLAEANVPHRLLTGDECRQVEPALNAGTGLAGGVHLPEDESGNCPLFARQLKTVAEDMGVRFGFGATVSAIRIEGDRATGVVLADGSTISGAVVVAGGADSLALLEPIGIRLPLYPVKGYSATVQLTTEGYAPLAAVMDESYKVAITRMGNRLRIAGTAELGSRVLMLRDAALRTLIKVARDWFPSAAMYSEATYWVGARPMMPDGPPVLGPTPVRDLYLNIGHGSTGWAMSCGAASVVADVAVGRTPEIDTDGLTLERYA